MQHLKRNKEKYIDSVNNAIEWFIDVLEQEIDLKALKENKLKRACMSKEKSYQGLMAMVNRNNLTEETKPSVLRGLAVAWDELAKVVSYQYKLAGYALIEENILEMTDEEIEEMADNQGITPDISTSVAEAKHFAHLLMINISDSIDALEADENVLEEKASQNKNPLQEIRIK